jgi:hypothetical protein
VILDDFESLGLLSRTCFDLLVKIIVVVLSRALASPDLNFSVSDVVVLLRRLLRYQRPLYLGTALSASHSRHYREAISWCAGHAQQLGGESPPLNLMEVKG